MTTQVCRVNTASVETSKLQNHLCLLRFGWISCKLKDLKLCEYPYIRIPWIGPPAWWFFEWNHDMGLDSPPVKKFCLQFTYTLRNLYLGSPNLNRHSWFCNAFSPYTCGNSLQTIVDIDNSAGSFLSRVFLLWQESYWITYNYWDLEALSASVGTSKFTEAATSNEVWRDLLQMEGLKEAAIVKSGR